MLKSESITIGRIKENTKNENDECCNICGSNEFYTTDEGFVICRKCGGIQNEKMLFDNNPNFFDTENKTETSYAPLPLVFQSKISFNECPSNLYNTLKIDKYYDSIERKDSYVYRLILNIVETSGFGSDIINDAYAIHKKIPPEDRYKDIVVYALTCVYIAMIINKKYIQIHHFVEKTRIFKRNLTVRDIYHTIFKFVSYKNLNIVPKSIFRKTLSIRMASIFRKLYEVHNDYGIKLKDLINIETKSYEIMYLIEGKMKESKKIPYSEHIASAILYLAIRNYIPKFNINNMKKIAYVSPCTIRGKIRQIAPFLPNEIKKKIGYNRS